MGLNCGIVGLPNVGKSTIFQAITSAPAEDANYPFCTIDPNVGVAELHDQRLEQVAALIQPKRVVPATIEFVDIAGLVQGASRGEGLGNQFLGHIRNVNAIAVVLRCFDDPDVTHVEGRIDPLADAETVETELGKPVFGVIPNDYQSIATAIDLGEPISAQSPIRAAIRQIASRLANREQATSGKTGWLSKLRLWRGTGNTSGHVLAGSR